MPTADPRPPAPRTAPSRDREQTADPAVPAGLGSARAAPRPGSLRAVLGQWPLALVLTLVWGALWQDFGLHVLLPGLLFAALVIVVFPMPAIPFSRRFSPWHALVFTGRFLADVVRSSLSVSAVVLTRGRRVHSSIVGVRLRSHDDLLITLVSHALALVPGSIVLDVDRADAILYLHCLNVTTDEEIAAVRAKALRVEAGIIQAVGSRTDLELLRRFPDSAPPRAEIAGNRRHPAYGPAAEEERA